VSGELRRAWRRLAAERRPGECPSSERLVDLVVGPLPDAERVRLAEHVTLCARCAADFRTLRETHAEAADGLRALGGERRAGWRLALVAAGLALLAAGVALVFGDRSPSASPDALRQVPTPTVSVSPPNEASLAEPPRELRWPAQRDARGYTLRLLDASGQVVWKAGPVAEARAELPADVRAKLAAGSYAWTVQVEGDEKERLGPFWFSVGRS